MICRTWRGWTTPANADAYEAIVLGIVIPGIERRAIPGFLAIDLLREIRADDVQFTTLMWFTGLEAVRAFMGDDYTISHVPDEARAVLARYDEHAAHAEVLGRRVQPRR